MLKKICFLMLVFLLCCCLTVPAFFQDYPVNLEKIDVSGEDLETVAIDEDSTIWETVETDAESVRASDYVLTIERDPEYLQWLYGTPKEVLSGSTAKLLEFFMESNYMGQQVYSCSSVPVNPVVLDYTYHTAFSELITRKDFLKQLDHYAENALGKSTDFNADEIKLKKVLEQAPVKALMGNVRNFSSQYPNLQSLQVETDTTVAATAVGGYVGTINGINYYSAGTISTANNLSAEVCVPNREWVPEEISDINDIYD
ncbi:MAG: hypothetical protein IJB47_04440 [Oscillospiraceae bacterium]|nr:hypothetical protein [Oscillospiraceae bacterium]